LCKQFQISREQKNIYIFIGDLPPNTALAPENNSSGGTCTKASKVNKSNNAILKLYSHTNQQNAPYLLVITTEA
jgi:hypothetical protein